MKIKILKESKEESEEQLEEISAMGGGAVAGAVRKDEEENLEELFSTSTGSGIVISNDTSDKEHDGHVERSKYQGLRNVMEEDEDDTWHLSAPAEKKYVEQGTVMKLIDLADNSKNASRVFDVLNDVKKYYGLENLKNTILDDETADNRAGVMEKKFGYDSGLLDRVRNGDEEAINKYYQFLINEFMLWISRNPRASAQMYSGRRNLLSKPTKDLAFGLISRYISNPSKNNPRSLGERLKSEAGYYELDADIDPAVYNLPE